MKGERRPYQNLENMRSPRQTATLRRPRHQRTSGTRPPPPAAPTDIIVTDVGQHQMGRPSTTSTHPALAHHLSAILGTMASRCLQRSAQRSACPEKTSGSSRRRRLPDDRCRALHRSCRKNSRSTSPSSTTAFLGMQTLAESLHRWPRLDAPVNSFFYP